MQIFIPFMMLLTVFLFVVSKNNKSTKYLAILLLAFLVDILSFLLYLGKDNYYYNIIQNYFGISRRLWDYFIFMPIRQDWIIRIMNLSSLSFLYFNLVFAASFLPQRFHIGRLLKWCVLPLAIQLLMYDPFLYKNAYLLLYPTCFSAEAIGSFYEIFEVVTYCLNIGYLLFGVSMLFYSYWKLRSVQFIKRYMFLIVASHLSIIITYSFLLLWAPKLLIKVSKVADYTSYLTAYLSDDVLIYNIFPYFLIFALAVITFGLSRYAMHRQQLTVESNTIAKEINAAAIASSVFSHYIKNQMISIMAQIENIQMSFSESEKVSEPLQNVMNDCQKVLAHMDTIHTLVESGNICLKPLALEIPIRNAISDLAEPLRGIQLNLQIPASCPVALIDSEYFEQVLINLITNDIEAMAKVPNERKRLDITVEEQSQWVLLSIRDYGTGIEPQYINRIFTPYFSTKSSSKNWGIGLSLCHKIITAHSGKIAVTSKIGEGTVFKILLPVFSGKKRFHVDQTPRSHRRGFKKNQPCLHKSNMV